MAIYSIFINHCWSEKDGMERLSSLMENYRLSHENFEYEYYSVSKDDPSQFLPSNKILISKIEEQIKKCSCMVLLAGVYEEFKHWTKLELDAAKKFKIPLVLIEAVDPKHTAHQERRAANVIVKWDAEELGEAIIKVAKTK